MAVALAWTAVALVLLVTVARTALEYRALRRLVAVAERPEQLKRAIAGLGHPHRPIVGAFVEGVHRATAIDEALTRSLVQAAQASFVPPPGVLAAAVVGSAGAVLTPVVIALATTAQRMAALYADARFQAARARYLSGASSLHPAFVDLGQAFADTATVGAALGLAWALRWWLLRPEAREARLCKALIECAGRIRPGAVAPAATRLAELTAPERGLQRPIFAALIWVLATSLGWLALIATADLRRANRNPKVFDVWPPNAERRVEVVKDVVLPRSDAGAPIPRSERPSLTIGPSDVRFHATSVLTLEDGHLPAKWRWSRETIKQGLADFSPPLEVLLLAHYEIGLDTVLPLLRRLAQRHAVARYHMVVERQVAAEGSDTASGRRRQARLPLEFRPRPSDVAVELQIRADGVRIQGETFINFDTPGWADLLRRLVRASPAVAASLTDPIVVIQTAPEVRYGRLIDVLSAADGACATTADCGLPGLGLRFIITTEYTGP